MKWFKRSLLSISRRKGKTLLLFLVVFAMISLLAAALCNISTAKNVKAEIQKGLGDTATITVNYSNLSENTFDKTFHDFIDISESLCESEYVNYGEYRITQDGLIHSDDLNLDLSIRLLGTNLANHAQLRSGEVKLSDQMNCRNFTEEELTQGENVILINMNLRKYTYPNLEEVMTGLASIGETFTLTLTIPYYYETEDGKIIYDMFKYPFEAKAVGTFVHSKSNEPSVYIPSKTLLYQMEQAIKEAKEQGITISSFNAYPTIQYAGFKLKDNAYLQAFDEQVTSMMKVLPKNFHYESSGKNYKRSTTPVENLDILAHVILVASIIATILIVGMVIVYLLFDRKKEIGILMAIGERKNKIIAQFMLEILLISTCAISLASIGGIALGNQLSNYMMQVQATTQRNQQLGNKAQYTPYRPVSLEEISKEEVLANYENKFTMDYFMTLFVIGEMTVLVSCILPMVGMTFMKPKEIMIGGN